AHPRSSAGWAPTEAATRCTTRARTCSDPLSGREPGCPILGSTLRRPDGRAATRPVEALVLLHDAQALEQRARIGRNLEARSEVRHRVLVVALGNVDGRAIVECAPVVLVDRQSRIAMGQCLVPLFEHRVSRAKV